MVTGISDFTALMRESTMRLMGIPRICNEIISPKVTLAPENCALNQVAPKLSMTIAATRATKPMIAYMTINPVFMMFFVELSFSNNHSISFNRDDFNRVILFDERSFCNDI